MNHPLLVSLIGFLTGLFLTVHRTPAPQNVSIPLPEESIASPASSFSKEEKKMIPPTYTPTHTPTATLTPTATNTSTPTKTPIPTPKPTVTPIPTK